MAVRHVLDTPHTTDRDDDEPTCLGCLDGHQEPPPCPTCHLPHCAWCVACPAEEDEPAGDAWEFHEIEAGDAVRKYGEEG